MFHFIALKGSKHFINLSRIKAAGFMEWKLEVSFYFRDIYHYIEKASERSGGQKKGNEAH